MHPNAEPVEPSQEPESDGPGTRERSHDARRSRGGAARGGFRRFLEAIDEGDEQLVESEVRRLSEAWRPLAPLALTVGAFVMLFRGLQRLWRSWRLIAVEVLPAAWAWAGMLNLKTHVLAGPRFDVWHGPLAAVLILVTVVVTVIAFYLNAVFAFAVTAPEGAPVRPAFLAANRHLLLLSGIAVPLGGALGVAAFLVPRWGRGWFALAFGIAVALEMLLSVVVPSRLVGSTPAARSRRDRMLAALIGGVLGAVVCVPTYAIGRIGILMLDANALFVLGVVLLVVGFGLQLGATGAVKAVKMSAKVLTSPLRTGTPAALPSDGTAGAPPSVTDPGADGDGRPPPGQRAVSRPPRKGAPVPSRPQPGAPSPLRWHLSRS